VDRFLNWALARAQEKSTWVGLASMLSGLGVTMSPDLQATVAEIGLAVSGLVLVLTKERGDPAGPAKE